MKLLAFQLFCGALALLELYRVGQRLWTDIAYSDFPSGQLRSGLAASLLYRGALILCFLRKRAGAILFLRVHLLPFIWISWIGFTVATEELHAAVALPFSVLVVLNWNGLEPFSVNDRS